MRHTCQSPAYHSLILPQLTLHSQDKRLANPGHSLPEHWDAIAVRHCAAVHALYSNDYQSAYTHQSALVSLFYRWFQEQPAWPLPVLYLLLRDLRELAEQADGSTFAATGRMPALEECTRTVSKAFSICATDRTFKGPESRRTGVYHVACLSLKCYFKVSGVSDVYAVPDDQHELTLASSRRSASPTSARTLSAPSRPTPRRRPSTTPRSPTRSPGTFTSACSPSWPATTARPTPS